jgi:hypothetical protein
MRFNILSDADWEARVDFVLDHFSGLGYRSFFEEKDYGPGVAGMTVVCMCQDPGLDLKRRVRFSKKEKKLYMDVMLNLDEMKAASPDQRKKILVREILEGVPVIVNKYDLPGFDSMQFLADFDSWFKGVNVSSS